MCKLLIFSVSQSCLNESQHNYSQDNLVHSTKRIRNMEVFEVEVDVGEGRFAKGERALENSDLTTNQESQGVKMRSQRAKCRSLNMDT